VPIQINDISEDGKLMVGQAGIWFTGLTGVMWFEELGWVKMRDFFRTQGVAEAYRYGLDHVASINARGTEMVGGIPGYPLTWYVDLKSAFVCRGGRSIETAFPAGFVDQVKNGAKMGRCEHQ
jgi:hypothetical protein